MKKILALILALVLGCTGVLGYDFHFQVNNGEGKILELQADSYILIFYADRVNVGDPLYYHIYKWTDVESYILEGYINEGDDIYLSDGSRLHFESDYNNDYFNMHYGPTGLDVHGPDPIPTDPNIGNYVPTHQVSVYDNQWNILYFSDNYKLLMDVTPGDLFSGIRYREGERPIEYSGFVNEGDLAHGFPFSMKYLTYTNHGDYGEYYIWWGEPEEGEVPEFSTIAAVIALLGATGGFLVLRKRY